ncbi:MAG: CBS domain-containing protein [Terriglobales bacterium]
MSAIRQALNRLGLDTDPDFNWTYLDAPVTFIPKRPVEEPQRDSAVTVELVGADRGELSNTAEVSVAVSIEPTFRVGRLGFAHRPPTAVCPDAEIEKAITIMLMKDFSQLPVMTNERTVKGLVSWRSIGSVLSLGRECRFVRDAMEPHNEITVDQSLFDAITAIKERDCVLVRDSTNKICGILTAYDISVTFRELAEPFLVLSEIENQIRVLIDGKFTNSELSSVRDPQDPTREIRSVADLTLGECVRLLESPQNWAKLSVGIDRGTFIIDLDRVRRIRNDVMHFDPEGIEDEDISTLREFAAFLQRLLINIGYMLCLVAYVGWFRPVIVPGESRAVLVLLGLLLFDMLTSRSFRNVTST